MLSHRYQPGAGNLCRSSDSPGLLASSAWFHAPSQSSGLTRRARVGSGPRPTARSPFARPWAAQRSAGPRGRPSGAGSAVRRPSRTSVRPSPASGLWTPFQVQAPRVLEHDMVTERRDGQNRSRSGPVPASSPRPPRVPLLRAKWRRIGCPGPPAPNRIRARGPAARPQRAGGGAVSPAGPRSQRRRDSMRDCLSPDAGLLVTCVWARDWSSADQLQVCLVAQLCFLPLSERLSFPAVLDSQARQGLACLRRTSGRIRTAWEVKCISAGIRGVRCASPGQSQRRRPTS